MTAHHTLKHEMPPDLSQWDEFTKQLFTMMILCLFYDLNIPETKEMSAILVEAEVEGGVEV